MSTMAGICDLALTPRSLPATSVPMGDLRARFRPWGFWASLGWALFAAAAGLFAGALYMLVWMLTHQLHIPNSDDAAFGTAAGIVVSAAPLTVLVVGVKVRCFSLREYLGLRWAQRRDVFLGIAAVVGIIVVFGAMESLLGLDGGSKFVISTYREAAAAGVLPILWLAMIVVAPVSEELLFRGFLHRGWVSSWLGVSGAIVLTSVLWAALHQQYNWLGILCIFVMGLSFGWLRQRSGSTSLTILLHAFNNLFAMIVAAVQIEWLS